MSGGSSFASNTSLIAWEMWAELVPVVLGLAGFTHCIVMRNIIHYRQNIRTSRSYLICKSDYMWGISHTITLTTNTYQLSSWPDYPDI